MKKFKSMLMAFIVAVLSAAIIMPLAACDDNTGANVIHITSLGGRNLTNVTVQIWDGEEMIASKTTDEEGKVSFDLSNKKYTVKLSELPAGYYVDRTLTVDGGEALTKIGVASAVIESGTPARKYVKGDVMYDFEQTVFTYNEKSETKYDTKKIKLSELFKEKKAVMLNFWYVGCTWCAKEYPSMKAAYELYADKLEIIGINDHYQQQDDATQINQTIEDEVPYLMCRDAAGIGQLFDKPGAPYTVMIDRYGVICEIISGAVTDQDEWEQLFKQYTADDYAPAPIDPDNPGGDIFVPDKPEDFNVRMAESHLISRAINKTGNSMLFSEDVTTNSDGGKSAWPWDLTEDKTAIYPTNTKHRGTVSIIYAEVELEKDQVLAFDYKVSSDSADCFYVAVDAREGIGKQVLMVSGQQDWTTGYAYVALEKGTHEIAFMYARTSVNGGGDDIAYVKNIRFTTIDDMNADLIDKDTSLEIAYPSVRQYFDKNVMLYNEFENVYLAKDGYYHVGKAETESANDPYLFADMTHSTPFFGNPDTSLYTVFLKYNDAGGMIIGGKNYTDQFASYVSYCSNSDYKGMVPVTEELKEILDAYYKDQIPANSPYYLEDGWQLFCVSHRTYGKPVELTDPIIGLAPFSAFQAKETTGLPDTDNLNTATFDSIVMPRGYLYKFVPEHSGVYYIHSTDTYIQEGYLESIDGGLFDSSLKLAAHLGTPLAESDSSRFYRYGGEENFKIYHYLNKGETYYVWVAFSTVEVLGSFKFRIDLIGDTYEYLSPATDEVYSGDETQIPVHADAYYDESADLYRDRKSGEPIYCDFTEWSFLFGNYPIEYILQNSDSFFNLSTIKDKDGVSVPLEVEIAGEKLVGRDFTEDMLEYLKTATPAHAVLSVTIDGKPVNISLTRNRITVTKDGKTGYASISPTAMATANGQTVTVKFGEDVKDSNGNITQKAPTVTLKLKVSEGKLTVSSGNNVLGQTDYTAHDVNDKLYGMVPVDKKLYTILQLTNLVYRGYSNDNEWLMACWYVVKLGPQS